MGNLDPDRVAERPSNTSSCIPTLATAFDEEPNVSVGKKAVVIVGAGSIGLWIAFHLAKTISQSTSPNSNDCNSIIVIEAADRTFAAASGTCTGCIHYGFKDEALVNLGRYSFALWEDLSQDDGFRNTTSLRFNSVFGLRDRDGKDVDLLPDWFHTEDSWKVNTEFLGPASAMVNPIGVGNWLTKACKDLGVQIWTSTTVTSVELDENNKVTRVLGARQDQSKIRFPCHELVLAGGPWTPSIYEKLFPSSSVCLELVIDAGDWILFRNPNQVIETSVAFVGLDDVVGEKLEFAGRGDATIWACGRRDHSGSLMPPGIKGQADIKMIAELTERTYRFLKGGHVKGLPRSKSFKSSIWGAHSGLQRQLVSLPCP